MTSPPALHELLFAGLLACGVAFGVMPHVAPRLPVPLAAVGGLAVGVFLHRVLAGRWGPHHLGRPRDAGGAVVLLGRAAVEELAWRGFLLGALVPALGTVGALLVSSGLFACARRVERRRDRLVHLLTGSVFGLVYVTTGQLAAAIASHVAYNALVAATVRDGAFA
jgi:hypothetical protein